MVLPTSPKHIPTSLKDNVLGQGFLYAMLNKENRALFEDIMREGMKRKDFLLKEAGTGEISEAVYKQIEGIFTKGAQAMMDVLGKQRNFMDYHKPGYR